MTFSKEGLTSLVAYNEKIMFEVKLKEIKSTLAIMINEETEYLESSRLLSSKLKMLNFLILRLSVCCGMYYWKLFSGLERISSKTLIQHFAR
jgi:hypothetical protein